MPVYKTKAIVLKSYKLGEADKIVKLFSGNRGIIDAVAKGSRKIKSKFGGRLELFNFVDLELSEGKTLDIITSAEILRNFKNIPLDFNKFLFCQMISEIVLRTHLKGSDDSSTLFKLMYVCFNEIDSIISGDICEVEKVAAFFLAKFLKITGYIPVIENCIICDKGIDRKVFEQDTSHDRLFFSIDLGGIICQQCSIKVKDSAGSKKAITGKEYDLLGLLFNYNLKDFRSVSSDPITLNNIYDLLGGYIKYHTECGLDIYTYLKKIISR